MLFVDRAMGECMEKDPRGFPVIDRQQQIPDYGNSDRKRFFGIGMCSRAILRSRRGERRLAGIQSSSM